MRVDTIVALITGSPPCPVAWLRLSGPDAYAITKAVFDPWSDSPEPRKAIYGKYAHGDDGLALPFPEDHSYTGEETVELSIHGSPASVNALLDSCIKAGARKALPGEFTQRAFMNGRLDLSQAEAVAETIQAQTTRELKESTRNREGQLAQQVKQIREQVIDLLAQVEARIDFSEEIGDLDHPEIAKAAKDLSKKLASLREGGRKSHLARKGLRVAIVGQPNAGKSSLLNRLLGFGRAIVTDTPGTTRDTLEETLEIDGIRVVLTDTAGLRETESEAEQEGVSRALQAAGQADLILYVYDATVGWTPTDENLSQTQTPQIILANKSDLIAPEHGLPISAKTGHGIPELTQQLTQNLQSESNYPATNERQSALLELAEDTINVTVHAAETLAPADLIATLLTAAAAQLGQITGETANPEMLDEIFSRFCIGK